MRQTTAWIIFSLAMLVYGLFFLIPLFGVIKGGFIVDGNFTLDYIKGVFSNPIYREGLFNSLLIGLGTTLLATLIALPLAWIANRFKFPLKGALTAMLLVPMILPPFVGAIGFQQIFGQYGVVNSAFNLGAVDWLADGRYVGVIVLQALSLYPIMYLNVAASLANIDHAMLEAAENMGLLRFHHVSAHHPTLDYAGDICRRNDHLYLGVYRTRYSAHHEFHPLRVGASV